MLILPKRCVPYDHNYVDSFRKQLAFMFAHDSSTALPGSAYDVPKDAYVGHISIRCQVKTY